MTNPKAWAKLPFVLDDDEMCKLIQEFDAKISELRKESSDILAIYGTVLKGMWMAITGDMLQAIATKYIQIDSEEERREHLLYAQHMITEGIKILLEDEAIMSKIAGDSITGYIVEREDEIRDALESIDPDDPSGEDDDRTLH